MQEFSIGGQERKSNEANEGIADIPQNRTLIVEQLTHEEPAKPEITYGLKTLSEVFEHFLPECEVEFTDAEGQPTTEKLQFRSLVDFGKKGITEQSAFLQSLHQEQTDYWSFAKVLKANKVLQKVLANPEAKETYLAAIQSLINEIDEVEDKGAEQ